MLNSNYSNILSVKVPISTPFAFAPPVSVGKVTNPVLTERSGLTASFKNPGNFWAQRDSGKPACIYLLSRNGQLLKTFNLINATNNDWEDIALYRDPATGKSYVYVFEHIGTVYRVEEPHINDSPNLAATEFIFNFPANYNCETGMIDPTNGDVFMVPRGPDNATERDVLWLPNIRTAQTGDSFTVIGTIQNIDSSSTVTAGSIGNGLIAIAQHRSIHVWPLITSAKQTLMSTPIAPIKLINNLGTNGESVAVGADGIYTTSEQVPDDVWWFERLS